jgi:cell volume regulation protein A
VFATLRFTQIRRRLARTLEAESGGNDPMAIALTLGLIAWIESPDTSGFGDLVLLAFRLLREVEQYVGQAEVPPEIRHVGRRYN